MPKSITGSENIVFKEEFIDRYSKLTNWEEFRRYSLSFLKRCIRINTLKIKIEEGIPRLQDWKLKSIPWCKEGFAIEREERRDIGNTLEHHLGYIYVQEAASMIPPIVLDPKPNEIVLDMAAAPGSKTSQMAALMNNTGLIVANDVSPARITPLAMNLQRVSAANTIITMRPGQAFKNFSFDRILLDAPCSGTGTIRRNLEIIKMWNANMIKRLSGIQKSLIRTAFENLKERGVLVYSTCSLEPEENEAVIDWLLNNYKDARLEKIDLNIKTSPPLLEFNNNKYSEEIKKCLRIWPQDNDTEGFFVAKITKNGRI